MPTPPAPVVVRSGRPDDLDAVVALERDCLGADAWGGGLVAPGLAGELPTVVYLVAGRTGSGRLVGHAVVSVVDDVAELQRIGVDTAHRRQGVAGLLLDGVLAQAEREGAVRVLLEVREDNAPALAFYARHGFAELARRRRYYADGTTAVVMERGLTGSG